MVHLSFSCSALMRSSFVLNALMDKHDCYTHAGGGDRELGLVRSALRYSILKQQRREIGKVLPPERPDVADVRDFNVGAFHAF